MAIDGPKIIDSDLANDVYGEFMELYDSGKTIDDIKKQIEKNWKKEDLDEDEFEIFITTYALALWEIGGLSKEIRDEVKATIEKGVGVSMWKEENEEEYAEKRKKILEKFILKISEPKKKIRSRIKKKEPKDFIFQPDDIVLHKQDDGTFIALFVASTYQFGSSFGYIFVPIKYKNTKKPEIKDLENSKVFVSKVPSGLSGFKKGLYYLMISHGALKKFAFEFEVLGKISIKNDFKNGNAVSYAKSKETFFTRATENKNYLSEDEVYLKEIIQN